MDDPLGKARLLALLPGLLLACHIRHPPGYEALVDSAPEEQIVATPLVMYSRVPHSWDLPDGRQIRVNVDERRLTAGMGFYRLELAFDVSFEGSSSAASIRCEADPSGPDMPESRFACWTEAGVEFEYYVARDEGCVMRDVAVVRTLKRPECWQGTLQIGAEAYEVAFAHLRRGWQLSRVSWVDSRGEVVQAADLVGEMQIELYRGTELDDAQRDALTLHAIALHQWIHSSDPDY